MSFKWPEFLGTNLVMRRDDRWEKTKELFLVNVVGLYFSAHWCPPCRKFTPVLAKAYEKTTKENFKNIAIIFLSSDRNQHEFDKYRKEMPWLAFPYSARKMKDELATKFGVRGIPTLVLLDANTGEVLTTNGRALVQKYGADFAKKALDPEVRKTINKTFQLGDWIRVAIRLLLVVAMLFVAYFSGKQGAFD